eukprot:CAMPEP_0113516748 /NCGR_PEP_ID=MMETSP0014_2-20120614/41791_1 /TAXON_ID=2857 /ORGANISM="Nitzschia sp." /LENGTH=53 /DNA_ID=CAMNT_0000413699 /DNA_START=1 /DNA_END=159 /DNA_ORIENTATION=- /assembly_acc=CAM_ASM_000159
MAEDGDDAGGDDVDEEYMASLAQDVEIMKVCYIKKYYDCMADKIIYFPSVQSS